MWFDLTEEQSMIRTLIRDFAETEVAPGADERDRTGEFPKEIFDKMAQLGLMGLPFPEQYQGGGADTISFAIVVEELSRVCGSTRFKYDRAGIGKCTDSKRESSGSRRERLQPVFGHP